MSDDDEIRPWPTTFICGLDLGQANDWTALCVNQLVRRADGQFDHQGRHLERWQGERYPVVVRAVGERVAALKGPRYNHRPSYLPPIPRPRVVLVVDYTGVGRPVVDMLEEARFECDLIPVTITAGMSVTRSEDGGDYRVPKRILASTLQVLLQTERFKVQRSLDLAATLQAEMKNFRVKINLLGHESYGAGDDWREGNHDDLVLAAALACWAGESGMGTGELMPVGGALKASLDDWFEQ